MWLDDDGDDDPFPGPVPDPSARQWRHPSEIAAENAKAAERAMAASGASAANFVPVAAPSGSSSILWPMSVVGGSIAIAAVGVLGLYLLGNPGRSELNATGSAADPTETVGSGLSSQARSITGPTTLSSLNPFANDSAAEGADDADAESLDATTDNDVGPGATEAQSTETTGPSPNDQPDSETGAAGQENGAAGSGPAASKDGPAGQSSVSPGDPNGTESQPQGSKPSRLEINTLSGPGIYPGSGRSDERLASLLVTDQHLITSASAVAGYPEFFVHLADRRIAAYVGYADPISDVAVVLLSGEAEALAVVTVPMAREPAQVRAEAFVGYCRSEVGPQSLAPAISTDVLAIEPRPGCSDGREYPDATGPQPEEAPPTSAEDGWSPGAGGDDEYVSPIEPTSAPNPLSGVIYATDVAIETRSDHTAYDLIRTDIERPVGGAGAPLRDVLGRLVGLVLGSEGYQVAALPIDRVLSVADSLVRWNVGSQAWIGMTGRNGQNGFVIESVSEASPLAELLAPGDIVLTVNGDRLLGQDHLVYLVREAGVGGPLSLTYRQPKQNPESAEILVAVHPDAN